MGNKTEPTPQQMALEKIKSVSRLKFEASIKTAIELRGQATAIIIKDEDTLIMANQILSKMNTCLNETKKKGLSLRRPYNDAADAIMSVEKEVTTPLSEGLKIGKEKLKEWNDLQIKIADDAKAKLEKQKNFFDALINQMQTKSIACTTPEMCQQLIDSINNKWPSPESFGNYNANALVEKKRYLDLLEIKKVALANEDAKAIEDAEKVATKASVEAKEAVEEESLQAKEMVADSVVKSNTRKTPTFEVIDAALIPREWLMIDEAKVKEYLASIKGQLENAPVIKNGIKFYIEQKVVIR